MNSSKSVTATRLKATLLGVLDEVERLGEPVTVTKHGRPVAQLVPYEAASELIGSIKFNVSREELISPLDVEWHALKD